MKNLFTLFVCACFSVGLAQAQDKTATPERVTKLHSKEVLKKAYVQPKQIDAATLENKRANVIRVDANNSKGIVLTDEQREARSKENAAKVERKTRVETEK